ncbi:GH25 family lysozyme [Arthrobacter sp. NPDC055585]
MKTKTLTSGIGSSALAALLALTCLAGPAAAVENGSTEPEAVEVSVAEQARIIGPDGASLGQGLTRINATGDAQTPAGDLAAPTAKAPDAAPSAGNWQPPGIQGIDVSSHQGNVDWNAAWNRGARFAYAKATEGTTYKNPNFGQQYNGSYNKGMIRGAYHFALPNVSSAVEQANFFVNNGGGWSADGKTLPPLLDIEYNPYKSLGNTCYDMSPSQMVKWIKAFSNQVKARTGRVPMIYTTTDWWITCTGNSAAFSEHPLHIANYNHVGAGPLPASWSAHSIWQYSSSGPFVGDSNVFNGSAAGLTALARNSAPQGPFKDVPANSGFAAEIAWLKNKGITTGFDDGTYAPLQPVNRDAMAAFLYRLSGSPAHKPAARPRFTDVPAGNQFYKEIDWLSSSKVTTGWNDGTFKPVAAINRDAMAAFLYRMAGSPVYTPPAVSKFRDVGTDHLFYKEISWLAATGISTGWTDSTFRPGQPIARDAMAAFLYRFDRKI